MGGYQSRRCLPLSVPFGGQDFRNGRDRDDDPIAVYGHMETLDVTVGKRVTAVQRIAGMGNRGFSTGSHLHFELYPTGSGAVDPLPWFAEHGVTF